MKLVALLAVVALLVLHTDAWNWSSQNAPWLGWLPADVAYHLLWLVVAALVLQVLMRITWPRRTSDDEERPS